MRAAVTAAAALAAAVTSAVSSAHAAAAAAALAATARRTAVAAIAIKLSVSAIWHRVSHFFNRGHAGNFFAGARARAARTARQRQSSAGPRA
jgi:hypothetical protein